MIFIFQILDRAHSMGALNFGYVSDDGILRGSVTPFMHFTNNNESKQSLGMISHKKSVITIFGHKIRCFHKQNFNSLRFWFIFGIKFRILNQIYIKND